MQFKWDSLPIVYKLFITLIGGIGLIIIALLTYLWGYESELMLKKEQDLLRIQSISVAQELTLHLNHLQKEVYFLSHLEVMDDMVVRDIDRRITNILEQKMDDLGESVILYTVAPDFTVIASSQTAKINTLFAKGTSVAAEVKKGKNFLFVDDTLYLFTPLYGSFDTHYFLGYLVISYPAKNFVKQLEIEQNPYRWLTAPPSIHYKDSNALYDMDDFLHDKITLSGMLEGWTFHNAMPKSDALALLYHFQMLLLSVFGIGLVLIAFLVWIIVLRIIKPLRELSDTAMRISTTGDYSQTVTETGYDEIGVMAHSFNALMFTTMVNLKRLELLGKTKASLQAKSSFLSAMSHELRTPLGSILSLTQYLITQPNTPSPVCETLEKIENSAHHLLGVINNILDYAKVESGKIEPHISVCNPIEIIQEALDLVSPLAEDKGLVIRTMFEPFEADFRTDSRLLGQVIINLLSNAIKFTDHGFIDVQLHFLEELFILEVRDTGCGIAYEALADLFDDFYQVRTNNQNITEGSGLGLAISKRIALLLQGDLYLRSEGEGEGTIALFHFRSFK
ncbi:MAG: HAMP domain-containing sensor histidine kinase [Sulfuricurvum sp.]|uniref:sensor histidine kinase n=1 Tax=Sulfuricurvum sp. TaxID=2025608 RepID=UPI0026273BB2|nr:HAMP domain-containing sensor histidine kinase [Sulfuricurvum sp.]MDD2828331.1 HAMP domain-containing sensor histidine kinase [Sulfuricurvum sp.]MDD4949714.1 HAMP domain-containing sensor histidine kinase [Sulfuricurvum sp.]